MDSKDTRVFFVVDSEEDNEELFTTLESAQEFAKALIEPSIRVQIVKNAYKENQSEYGWNYNDLSDTFGEVLKTY